MPLLNFDAQNNESLITIEYSNASFTFDNGIGGLVEMTGPYIADDLTATNYGDMLILPSASLIFCFMLMIAMYTYLW